MKKRASIILISSLVMIGLPLGIWFFFLQADSPQSPRTDLEGYQFPISAEAVRWDDREIFRFGLTDSAADVLNDLPLASSYFISLEIPQDLSSSLHGHQIVRYFNAEEVDLTEIYFRLFPNYHGGQMEVSNLSLEGSALTSSYQSKDTALLVDLKDPLLPGDSLILEMDFVLQLPTEIENSSSFFGYFDGVLVLDSFYPLIPAYDDLGWYKGFPQGYGDLTYNDASFYVVQVKAPADLILASSGVIVDQTIKDGTQTTLIANGPARDFYLAGSREFVEASGQVANTQVRVYTKAEYSLNQSYALDYASNAIQILSDQIDPYPYTEFEIISSVIRALGMEYPGITSILTDEFAAGEEVRGIPSEQMLEATLVHEIGHMWFYNAVGNDQQNQPWLDEAIVQYLTYIYFLERYGDGSGYIASWNERWSQAEYAEIPIGMPAEEYQDAEYSAIVYGRGPLFFLELEKRYGREMVMNALRLYYQDNLWDLGSGEEIRAALEESCQCDLSTEFEEWVY